MAVPTRTIYVGNIPYTSTSESLMEALADYEPISVKVIDGKGVAFVDVPARRAFAIVRDLDGSKLEGRMLAVSIATPRENEPTFTQEQDHERARRTQSRVDYNGPRPNDRPYGGNPRFSSRETGNDQRQDRPNYQNLDDRPSDRGSGPRPEYGNRPSYGGGPDRGDRNRPPRSGGYQGRPSGDRPPYQGRSRFGGDNGSAGAPTDRNDKGGERPRKYGDRPPYQPNSDRPSGFNRDRSRPDEPRGGGSSNPGYRGSENSTGYRGGNGPRPDSNRGGFRSGPPSGGNFERSNRPGGDSRGPKPPYKPKSSYSGSEGSGAPSSKPRKFFKKR